jgi:hypothetical protein
MPGSHIIKRRTGLYSTAIIAPAMESLEGRLMLSTESLGDAALLSAADTSPAYTSPAGDISAQAGLSTTVLKTIATPAAATEILVSGSVAYILSSAGVQLADISDADNPQVLANYATVGLSVALALSDGIMYVGQSDGTIDIVDVSDPASPELLSQVDVGASACDIAYMDTGGKSASRPRRLYVAALGDGLKVVDVTDTANPVVMNAGSAWAGAPVTDVAIVGTGAGGWGKNRLAIIAGQGVLLTSAANPNSLVIYNVGYYSDPCDLQADGLKLYVTDSTGLYLVNAGNFSSPAIVWHVWANAPTSAGASGQLAFITGPEGVTIIDTGAPSGPAVIGQYDNANAGGVYVSGSTMYVACADSAWRVVDLGILSDLGVSGDGSAFYYATSAKKLNLQASLENLGSLATTDNLGVKVSVYLSADATLDASDYLLTPAVKSNANLAAGTDMLLAMSLKVSSSVPQGDYYLIYKLETTGLADSDTGNNIWVAPSADVRVLQGKPAISVALASASDTGLAGDNVTNLSAITLEGSTRAYCTVVLKRGKTVLATTTSAADGTFSFAGVALTGASNKFTILVTDQAGNIASGSKTIIRDSAVAKTTIALAPASDTGLRGDNLTNIASVLLNGKTEKNSQVVLSAGGVQIAQTLANSRGVYSFAGVILAGGDNDIAVTVTDPAGNTSTLHQTIVLDNVSQAPTLELAANSDTGTIGDNITTLSRVKLIGTAEAGSKVTLKVMRNDLLVTLASATADSAGQFTLTGVRLTAGANSFTFYATDPAGNTSYIPLLIELELA